MKSNQELLKDVQQALTSTSLGNFLSNIYILVHDGVVTIAGRVMTEQLKDLAEKIISGIPGVSNLIDNIQVESVTPQRVGVQIDWPSGRMMLTRD